MDLTNPLHLILFIFSGLAVLAFIIWLIVFLVKPSRGRDALSLAIPFSLIGRKKRKHHVFVGVSPYSKLMAAHLLREWDKGKDGKSRGRILFVNLSDHFNPLAERQLRAELDSNKVRLFNALPADALSLRGLRSWLANKRTSLYLFADSPDVNALLLAQATADPDIKAKVFYYTPDPDGFDALVAATGSRVRTLNPHQMAFRHLTLQCPELMPFNYVKKAVDASGAPLGYVTEGLHALVIGFGNTGQEAVRFLYEFGNFVGKDMNQAPLSIKVYDPTLETNLGAFLESAPQLKDDKCFSWCAESAGSVNFWQEFAKERFNYIIVAMDDGPQNLQMGVSLLQAAARAGQDLSSMLILMRYWQAPKRGKSSIRTTKPLVLPCFIALAIRRISGRRTSYPDAGSKRWLSSLTKIGRPWASTRPGKSAKNVFPSRVKTTFRINCSCEGNRLSMWPALPICPPSTLLRPKASRILSKCSIWPPWSICTG